ncbi:MAG: shikimate kinase [Smithella sp.]|jgi:shikimate kinase|nr:shikimate kinase [Smithella sp.]
MKIILIGYRATGKTTVGHLLADKIGIPFVDTDRLIEEAAGMTVGDVIQSEGWEKFRDRETQAVLSLREMGVCIVATGGGAIVRSVNTDTLKKEGILIYLKARSADIVGRLRLDEQRERTRPRFTSAGLEAETIAVLNERIPLYETLADYTADTSDKSPPRVADEIYEHLLETGVVAEINSLKKVNR